MNSLIHQDVVVELPDVAAKHKMDFGSLPPESEFEPGYFCVFQDRYFIHTRATLPLKAIDDGIGFGLWVELGKADFDTYMGTEDDDDKYREFWTEGYLANNWPGFVNMIGLKVLVKTIRTDEKVYIWEVFPDKPRDPLFNSALELDPSDLEKRRILEELVLAYMHDFGLKV